MTPRLRPGQGPGPTELQLSRLLSQGSPLSVTVGRLAHLARTVVAGVDEASVTVVEDGRPMTVASTGEVADRLDRRQHSTGSGPCLDAAQTGLTVHVPDMAAEGRYAGYAEAAARAGVARSLSVGLPVPGRSQGCLNLYARSTMAFDPSSVAVAEAFATHAALTVGNAALYAWASEQAQHMREAMASRAAIEQAKGMVMAARGCTADEAFEELRRLGSLSRRKVRVVAEEVVGARGSTLDGPRQA